MAAGDDSTHYARVKQPRFLPLGLAVGVLSISTAAVFIKVCMEDGASASVIAAARMGLATLVVIPLAVVVRGRRVFDIPRDCLRPAALSGIFLGAHFFFWITSLSSTSVLSSVVIVTTNPIFVGLASFLFLKERLHWQLIAGIVLAAAGGGVIALLDRHGTGGSLYGDFMSLCGAVMMSCYLLSGRRIRAKLDVWSYVLVVYSVAAVFLIAIAAFSGDRVWEYPPRAYIMFALLALVPQLIGHGALNWALGHATATIIAVCILGEPIAACAIAYMFLGERLTWPQGVGGALILIGILVSMRQSEPKSKSFEAISSGPEGP